jgi:hypothetical protein
LGFTGGDVYTYQRPAGGGVHSLNDGNYKLTVDKDHVQRRVHYNGVDDAGWPVGATDYNEFRARYGRRLLPPA